MKIWQKIALDAYLSKQKAHILNLLNVEKKAAGEQQ